MARNERCLKCNRLKYHTGTGVGMAHPKCKCNNMTKETKRTNGGKPHVCGTIQVFNGGKDGITLCGKCNMPIDSIETPMEETKHIVIDQAVEDLSGYYPTSNKLPNKEEVKELAHEMNIEVDLSPSDKTLEERLQKIIDSYKNFEESGHIPHGSVSEVINWDEIRDLFTSATIKAKEEERERIVNFIKRWGTLH